MESIDSSCLSKAVKEILKSHPALTVAENGRVRCSVTNHEMLCKEDAIRQHVSGKRFKRLTKNISEKFDYKQYEPHLTQSVKKGHQHQLFCTLTLRHVNKVPSHVLLHVKGKRYSKAKLRWEECQKSGTKFVPAPLLNRPRGGNNEMEQGKAQENGNESDDSFSDLYPAEIFERLTISSDDGSEPPPKAQPKKKKKATKKAAQTKPEAKRKSLVKDQAARPKKPRLSKPKKNKPKNGDLIVF